MGKYISLGEYNKLYKYIWIYLILRFLLTYIFANDLIFDQFDENDFLVLPGHPFITPQYEYIGYIIISLIIILINKFLMKKSSNTNLNDDKLIYNELDIKMEFGVKENDIFLFVNIFFLVLKDLLEEILPKFGTTMFTYWMFEMLYYELFHSRLFKTKIYRHHIFSFIFILSSTCILKSVNIIINFANNTDDAKFFENRKWLIPTSIIVYFLFRVFKTYTFANIKYYFDKRVISITNFILIYGIFGFIATLIIVLISTLVPCGDDTLPELSKKICAYSENNHTSYYLDSYIIFHKEFSSKYYTARIFILIIRSVVFYTSTHYIFVIYKKLSPIYYICMNRLNVLILNILLFINSLINKDNSDTYKTTNIIDIVLLVFYLLGSIIYLEFIELNFCGLNFYTKRNIKRRANTEFYYSIENIGNVSSDSESISGDGE